MLWSKRKKVSKEVMEGRDFFLTFDLSFHLPRDSQPTN
jgi:hypothetical protein